MARSCTQRLLQAVLAPLAVVEQQVGTDRRGGPHPVAGGTGTGTGTGTGSSRVGGHARLGGLT